MKTDATDSWPEIHWEIGKLLEADIDERMEVFEATGTDNDGYTYEGVAYFYGGEFEEMKEISLI
jgi:hypothetical protein